MENKGKCIQLIDGDGTFNFDAVTGFLKAVKFGEHGNTYRVVSIIGHQSSGKSTLLNHLFQTNFVELDASKGRQQTTKGIWLGTCSNYVDPFTLVLDLEGTDGKERGEDDTTFEKQSALFALLVSDIVIINIWYTSVGLENAANSPLIKTIIQAMMQLSEPHKKMLLFVIRDKEETPLENLETILIDGMNKIWNSLNKPPNYDGTQLNDIFNMKFVALPHYKYQKEQFKKEVQDLKQRLAINMQRLVAASSFVENTKHTWEDIKTYKDLNLPTYRKMIATARCEDIIIKTFDLLAKNEGWCKLQTEAKLGPVDEFGKKLREILDGFLAGYDEEAAYFDKEVSSAKRQQLESRALNDAYPAYQDVLQHLSSRSLHNFTNRLKESLQRGEGLVVAAGKNRSQCLSEFNEGCKDACVEPASRDPFAISWDPSKVEEELRRDISKHTLAQLASQYKEQFSAALEKPLRSLLEAADDNTWQEIRKLLGRETEAKRNGLSRDLSGLSGFDIDQEIIRTMPESLAENGRGVVQKKARVYVNNVKVDTLMSNRFFKSFDAARDWTVHDDIPTIVNAAYSESLQPLSVLAAIRLDNEPDNIKNTLLRALMNDCDTSRLTSSSTWEGVAAANVLIKPVDCMHLWMQLKKEVQPFVDRAYVVREKAKESAALEEKAKKAQLAADAKAQEAETAKQAKLKADLEAEDMRRSAEAADRDAKAAKVEAEKSKGELKVFKDALFFGCLLTAIVATGGAGGVAVGAALAGSTELAAAASVVLGIGSAAAASMVSRIGSAAVDSRVSGIVSAAMSCILKEAEKEEKRKQGQKEN